MKLLGTTTSPFVRRVRVVAAELGVEVQLVSTAGEAGAAELRAVSPIGKIPVAELDGQWLYDSRVIIDWLTTTRGWGRLAPPRNRWTDANLLNAIDAALESTLQLFYLRRDSPDTAALPFAQRQRERATTIFAWLGKAVDEGQLRAAAPGLPELALLCALDWIAFREAFDTAALDARFAPIRAALERWPSVLATRPQG
ncbi:MAG: glutathione S-transferase [Proteobacteria bacterium]|nr:glutathione S-transferase [Pseudomonadota bacterium]